jgi:hypothetical protein
MALATLAQIKLHLGIPDATTTYDNQLTQWLNAAISAVINYCGTSFESATRTEYYSPDGYNLILQNRPVISITSVYENAGAYWGQAASPWTSDYLLTAGVDYALKTDSRELTATYGYTSRSGVVVRLGKPWARRFPASRPGGMSQYNLSVPDLPAIGSVQVVYVSGYTTIPAAITQAVCWEVDAYRARAGKAGQMLTAESLGEYSYSLAQQAPVKNAGGLLSEAARTMLSPFRVLSKGLAI